MKLSVQRLYFTTLSTVGKLFIDDEFECFTLEPRKDQSFGKPYCIPVGTYSVILQFSNHFQEITPHLLNVPNFDEIEIHPGNFPKDTEGCTLVGQTYDPPDFIGRSHNAFLVLMEKLPNSFEISYQETL